MLNMSKRGDREFLIDMLIVCEKIMKYTRDLSYEDFRRNDVVGKNEANNREKECPRQGNRSFAGDKLGVYSAC